MSVGMNVYGRAPVSVQNALVTVSGGVKAAQRYGRAYFKHRRWLSDFDGWPLERMIDYQARELRRLISNAVERSPFYREFYSGIDVSRVKTPEDLTILPVLEKEYVRQSMTDLYTVGRWGAIEGHTGGTTGKSLVVRYKRGDEMRRLAMIDHFRSRHGFESLRMRKATFSGKHLVPLNQGASGPFWRYNAFSRQMLYSTFHMSERNLGQYVESLNHFQPQALDGFFTSLCDVASYVERHGVELSFQPVAIFPTSETLTRRGRDLLERVFHARVYDQYASSEGAPFVTECSQGSLHIELSTGVFECDEASGDGKEGQFKEQPAQGQTSG